MALCRDCGLEMATVHECPKPGEAVKVDDISAYDYVRIHYKDPLPHRPPVERKVVDYTVVRGDRVEPTHIHGFVTTLLRKDWELHGDTIECAGVLCQAMVKYGDPE